MSETFNSFINALLAPRRIRRNFITIRTINKKMRAIRTKRAKKKQLQKIRQIIKKYKDTHRKRTRDKFPTGKSKTWPEGYDYESLDESKV